MFKKDKTSDAILTNAVLSKAAPNHSLCPSLDLKTRIRGFFFCLFLGSLLGLFSCGVLSASKKGSEGLI